MANRIQRAIHGLNERATDWAHAATKSWPDEYYGYPRVPWTMDLGDAAAVRTDAHWMNSAAAWSAVRVIAEDMASMPLFLYRKSADGGREKATDHHLYATLHDYANPQMTSFAWRETSQAHVLTWGNCYSEKVIDRAGRLQLYPQRPDRMEVSWGPDGQRVYAYLHPTKGRVPFKPGTIFHVAGLSWDGLKGISPITLARQSLSIGANAESFASSFYRNGARPALVLTVPAGYPEQAKANMKDAWEKAHSAAAGRAGGTGVLEDGITVKELSMPLDDAQFLETRKFQITEIARWFRLPPDKLGDLEHATFSNIEQQELNYVIHSLRPWLVRWEQAIAQQLLQGDSEDVYAEFQMDGLLRGDSLTRASALSIQFRSGVLSQDEWRSLENRNPWPGAAGDLPMVSADMQSMSALAAEKSIGQTIDQVKEGLLTHDEGRALLGHDPMAWNDGLAPDEAAVMIEQVKAGILTENEARELMHRPPMVWSEDLTSEESSMLIDQVKAGLRTENEARELLQLPPMQWSDGPSAEEMTLLLEQLKAGVITHDEIRSLLKRPPVIWSDDLGPEDMSSLIDQVKAGLITENEARELMKRPPIEWAQGPSPDEVAGLVAQIKEGLLTVDEARGALGRPPVQWPEDLSEKVTQAGELIKAGFDPADVMATLGLPPIRHLGLPPITIQKPADAAALGVLPGAAP